MTTASTSRRATASTPCPRCGATQGCSITDDGQYFCRGDAIDPAAWTDLLKGKPDAAGFHHYRLVDDDRQKRNGTTKSTPSKPTPARDWNAEAERLAAALTPVRRAALARSLGLPVESLAALQIGWLEAESCWTFPEMNAAGRVTGIDRRYHNGSKKVMGGGKRGLAIPAGWKDRPGPLLLPEGSSDVLALSQCGLACIGRPNNVGGVELLAELLHDEKRDIVVMGENDGPKPDGKWPGKEGAETTAKRLSELLKRPVRWSMPPGEIKDARVWVHDFIAGQGDEVDYAGYGREIVAHLIEHAVGGPKPSLFKFVDTKEFRAGDYRRRWLVPKILARGDPSAIAGPSKTLKTSLLVDLVVSLATATPFLGRFPVPERVRCALVSGESGEQALKETFFRVLAAKGLPDDAADGWLKWEFNLPTFSDLEVMTDFAEHLARVEADFAGIDPMYQCLGDPDASNMFEVGPALKTMNGIIKSKRPDLTLSICHHSNRQLKVGRPMELTDLAFAGLEQFAGQWILLNRRDPYESDGKHQLWANIGGRAGHSAIWGVDVEEGMADENFEGRRWDVKVMTRDDVKAGVSSERVEARRDSRLEEMRENERTVLAAIDAEIAKGARGATLGRIRAVTGCSYDRARGTVDRLLACDAVEAVELSVPTGQGGEKSAKGFKRTSD